MKNSLWIFLEYFHQKNKKKRKFTASNHCRATKLLRFFFLKINSILYLQIENYKSENSSEICARIYGLQIEQKKLMKSLKNLLHFHRFQTEKIFIDIPLLLSFYPHPLKTNKYLSNSEILCLFYLHLYSLQNRDVIWKYYLLKCELFEKKNWK